MGIQFSFGLRHKKWCANGWHLSNDATDSRSYIFACYLRNLLQYLVNLTYFSSSVTIHLRVTQGFVDGPVTAAPTATPTAPTATPPILPPANVRYSA